MASEAFVASDGDGDVLTYSISQYSSSGVNEAAISFGYCCPTVSTSSGVTVLRVKDMEISGVSSAEFIWASGPGPLSYHGSSRGGMNIDFTTGGASASNVDKVERSTMELVGAMCRVYQGA